MKYRLTAGCVTVTGRRSEICSRKMATTLPLDPITLPSRTAFMRHCAQPSAATVNSASRLDAPMMLCGLTALSVDTSTGHAAPWRRTACASLYVPSALLQRAATGLCSNRETCLTAAA